MTEIHNNNIKDRFQKYLDYSNLDFKQYQSDGVLWCVNNETKSNETKSNENERFRGGFIADEMGLGKTITMIGTFLSNFVKKTLIVLPPVLIDQWYTQIYKTTGHKAVLYYGQNKKKINLENLTRGFCIVITSYAHIAFSKNEKKEEVAKDIHSVKWDRIVFDEAHHLRNKNTCIYKGALGLQGRIKWLVSGTPIQNKKADFYNLCKIIGISEHLYKNDENYPVIRRDYILKRTKKEVGISIPDLNVNLEAVCWKNSNEMNMSCDIHSFLNFSKGSSSSNNNSMKVSCWLSCQFDNGVLPLYLRARQMCIYPKLVRKFVRDMVIDGIITESEYADVIKYSSKLDAVIRSILRNKDNGNGKIIFCSFREEIDDIALRLKEKGFNSVATFDGRNNGASRKTILVEKNDVLILQIQTGCEGLNLQEHYSEVYFVSPNWNPAIEEQAVARCHRIGQKKNVNVYRFEMIPFVIEEDEVGEGEEKEFVSSMSIDNYMNIVQENKLIIAREILEV